MKKICVYAICKNEANFVERWLASMSEADYVVVLDTGSTDNTFELLKNDPRVFRAEQKVITPWRFDVARNESMKLIPDDAEFLVCTDLDEAFEQGWAATLKDQWEDGYDQYWYKYHWSHDEAGNPLHTLYYNKIHNRNYKWEFPVHETLKFVGEGQPKLKDCFDLITLHHYPDNTKSRGSYLSLLELRVKENPQDLIGRLYYGRELYFYGKYKQAIDVLSELTTLYESFTSLEKSYVWYLMGQCYYYLSNSVDKVNLTMATECCCVAIELEDRFRSPYLLIAQILWEQKLSHASICVLKTCNEKSIVFNSWLEEGFTWHGRLEDLLSLNCYDLKDYNNAILWGEAALRLDPTNERIANNIKLFKTQITKGENYGTD